MSQFCSKNIEIELVFMVFSVEHCDVKLSSLCFLFQVLVFNNSEIVYFSLFLNILSLLIKPILIVKAIN